MVRLTRLNRQPVILNSDLVEHMDATPDTVITLISGQKILVMESTEEVVKRIIEFRRALTERSLQCDFREQPE